MAGFPSLSSYFGKDEDKSLLEGGLSAAPASTPALQKPKTDTKPATPAPALNAGNTLSSSLSASSLASTAGYGANNTLQKPAARPALGAAENTRLMVSPEAGQLMTQTMQNQGMLTPTTFGPAGQQQTVLTPNSENYAHAYENNGVAKDLIKSMQFRDDPYANTPRSDEIRGSNFVNFDRYFKANQGVSNRLVDEQLKKATELANQAYASGGRAGRDFHGGLPGTAGAANALTQASSGFNPNGMGSGTFDRNWLGDEQINSTFANPEYTGQMSLDETDAYKKALTDKDSALSFIRSLGSGSGMQAAINNLYGLGDGQSELDAALAGTAGKTATDKAQKGFGTLNRYFDNMVSTSKKDSASAVKKSRDAMAQAKQDYVDQESIDMSKQFQNSDRILKDFLKDSGIDAANLGPDFFAAMTPDERKKLAEVAKNGGGLNPEGRKIAIDYFKELFEKYKSTARGGRIANKLKGLEADKKAKDTRDRLAGTGDYANTAAAMGYTGLG